MYLLYVYIYIGWIKLMLPTDRPPWSNKVGDIKLEKDDFNLPSQ